MSTIVFESVKRRRAAGRVRPGSGRVLQGFRWWQLPGRALFYLRLAHAGGGRDRVYAVDVRHWQNQGSGGVKADLYCDGRHVAKSKLPAAFAVEGGTIEVAMSGAGIKRCHYIADGGGERQLSPDSASAEGRRARLEHNHPRLSTAIAAASAVMLLIGVVLLVLQIAAPISQIPPIAESVGSVTSPVDLPVWLNTALGAGAIVASIERSLRLRYHWLLDTAGR
jgi:hypothetical protein